MNTGNAIRQILFVMLWLAIGGGMLTLLIAAIGKQKKEHCRDYTVRIRGVNHNLFVDEKDVVKLLKAASNGNIKGQAKTAFNLQKMERLLEDNVWIRDAELYFDNRDVLHVSVTEREPVARIFTMSGKSWYMDETGKRMPLSDKLSPRLPVFTGFPEKILSKRDSILVEDICYAAKFILDRPFWLAQVSQVDITSDRNLEMIPVVGNHVVQLGDAKQIERKFHRLFVFYKNVLSKAGFDKYKAINVQYAGQVVAVAYEGTPKPDLEEFKKNVEKLLRLAREVQTDSEMAAKDLRLQRKLQPDPVLSATTSSRADTININEPNAGSLTNPVPVTDPVSMKLLPRSKEPVNNQ